MTLFCFKVVNIAMVRLNLDIDYIVKEYGAGRSVLDLATELNVSRNVIDTRLMMAGVTKRTASEQMFIRASKMTPEQRSANAKAAHDAVRGTPKSFVAKVKNAIAKQASMSGMSDIEEMICSDLKERGIYPIPQLAIGPYNCDLACHPVAVEIFGGHWHFSGRHLARTEERIRYLGNAGWHVLMIVVNKRVPAYRFDIGTRNHIVAHINKARSNPSAPREYRVIDCRGKTLAAGRCDDSHISVVPAPYYSRDADGRRYKRVAG